MFILIAPCWSLFTDIGSLWCVFSGVLGRNTFFHHCEEVVGNLRPLLGTTLEDEDEIIQVDINACDCVGAFLGIQGGPAGVVMCLLDPSVRSRSGVV